MMTEYPELLRMIVLEIKDSISLGSFLLTSKSVIKSLTSGDVVELKKEFSLTRSKQSQRKTTKFGCELVYTKLFSLLPNGKRSGKFIKFVEMNTVSRKPYEKNITFNEASHLLKVSIYRNGVKEGIENEYEHPEGLSIRGCGGRIQRNFKNGVKDGEEITWSSNNDKKSLVAIGTYKDGLQEKLTVFDKNGNVLVESLYKTKERRGYVVTWQRP